MREKKQGVASFLASHEAGHFCQRKYPECYVNHVAHFAYQSDNHALLEKGRNLRKVDECIATLSIRTFFGLNLPKNKCSIDIKQAKNRKIT